MSDELFESSLRDQQRTKAFRERNARLAKMKTKPMSVRETLESGREGRLFTSAAGADASGVTRAINPDQALEDATPVEIGRTLYVQEEIKEAQAAARQPLPAWAEPLTDAQVFENLDELFPDEAAFNRWCAEHNPSAETVERIAAAAMQQRRNKAELAELARLVPTWEADLPQVVDFLKRTRGTTDQEIREWLAAPNARQFHAFREQWKAAGQQAAFARSKRTGRMSDAAEAIASMIEDPIESPRQRVDNAAMRDGLLGKLEGTVDGTMSSEFSPFADRERSLNAAADYFDAVLGVNTPADVEDAEDRSTIG